MSQVPTSSCILCRLPVRWCICPHAPYTPLKADLTLLVHNMEWRKSSNTGHLIRSVFSDWRVVVQGKPHVRITNDELLWSKKTPYVLFPGKGARSISDIPERERAEGIHLIIPDGNWRQSSHMLKRITPLHGVPAIMLTDEAPANRRMRMNISPERMSTFEAVVLALNEAGQFPSDASKRDDVPSLLMHFFRMYADRMLMLRGLLKAKDIEQPKFQADSSS